jgi:hypothetical protein
MSCYRPQFAYPGSGTQNAVWLDRKNQAWQDESAEFLFNSGQPLSTTAGLNEGLNANQTLLLDDDADFYCRAALWFFETLPVGGIGVAVRFRDAWGNYLSSDFVLLECYVLGAVIPNPASFPAPSNQYFPYVSGMGCVFEPELYCPKGSVLSMDAFNQGNAGAAGPYVLMRGVKRRQVTGACQ